MSDRDIGLLAGWGDFPVTVARRLVESGYRVHTLGFRNHADPVLAEISHSFEWTGIARSGAQLRFFRKRGIRHATMAGKLFKTLMFEKRAWLRHFPDLTFLKHYWRHFVSCTANRNDDELLLNFVKLFHNHGIEMSPATSFAPELLVSEGTLTSRHLTDYQMGDVHYGWMLAKQMGGLDIGQTVAVKGRAVLAVEAIEGTDECIRRAGLLCPSGGFTVVKVAKPGQDMRFDVPTIGIGTLQTIRDVGGSVLAVEAGKTIILGQEDVIQFANRNRIAIVAISEAYVRKFARVA